MGKEASFSTVGAIRCAAKAVSTVMPPSQKSTCGFSVPEGLPAAFCLRESLRTISTKFFIQHVVENGLLKCFYAFTNRGYIFPDIESTLSFALVTYGRTKTSTLKLAAQLWQVEHLADEGRVYSLDRQTIRRINPNTLNLPILQGSQDAFLVSDIHRRIPIAQQENGNNQGTGAMLNSGKASST